jgi:hypothetical protein
MSVRLSPRPARVSGSSRALAARISASNGAQLDETRVPGSSRTQSPALSLRPPSRREAPGPAKRLPPVPQRLQRRPLGTAPLQRCLSRSVLRCGLFAYYANSRRRGGQRHERTEPEPRARAPFSLRLRHLRLPVPPPDGPRTTLRRPGLHRPPARANTTAAPRDRPHPPTPGPRVLMRGHTRDPHRRASATSRPPPRPCPGQYSHYAGLHYAAASPNWPLWLLDNDPRCLADSAAILPLSLPPAQFQADSTLLTLAASSPPQSHALSCFPITTDSGPTAAALPKYCKKISYTVRLKNLLLLTPPNTPKTP